MEGSEATGGPGLKIKMPVHFDNLILENVCIQGNISDEAALSALFPRSPAIRLDVKRRVLTRQLSERVVSLRSVVASLEAESADYGCEIPCIGDFLGSVDFLGEDVLAALCLATWTRHIDILLIRLQAIPSTTEDILCVLRSRIDNGLDITRILRAFSLPRDAILSLVEACLSRAPPALKALEALSRYPIDPHVLCWSALTRGPACGAVPLASVLRHCEVTGAASLLVTLLMYAFFCGELRVCSAVFRRVCFDRLVRLSLCAMVVATLVIYLVFTLVECVILFVGMTLVPLHFAIAAVCAHTLFFGTALVRCNQQHFRATLLDLCRSRMQHHHLN